MKKDIHDAISMAKLTNCYNNLVIEDKDYFNEVKAFAIKLKVFHVLNESLKILSNYHENTRCRLFKDFAPYSFQFVLDKKQDDNTWKSWINGGLIYSGPNISLNGSSPTFCVSLAQVKKHNWSIHT